MIASGPQVPQRSRIKSRPRLWILGVLAIIVALVGVLWYMSPRIVVTPSRAGLLRVNLTGFDARISQATFSYGHRTVKLVAQGSRLEPVSTVSAGASGTAHIVVTDAPFLSWLPGGTATTTVPVTVPVDPRVAATHVNRMVNSNMVVAFRAPVSQVTYTTAGMTKTLNLNNPSKSVTLPLSVVHPGQTGMVSVSANATPWESLGSTQRVSWTAVPYVTVSSSPQSAIAPTGKLTLSFSQPLKRANTKQWQVHPGTRGTWTRINPTTYTFTPSGVFGFGPGALVTVSIPGGSVGPEAVTGSYLAHSVKRTWITSPGSVLRLQQLLATAGYLPVSWQASSPSTGSNTMAYQVSRINNPPAGTFQWKYPNLPQALKNLWSPGQMTVMVKGALMQFERANGLNVDGIAGPMVWKTLLADHIAGKLSPDGYTYISVTESLPETLELWVNGKLVLSTPANTGIPATPTYIGTYPIYERLKFQIMRGKNPNGVPYADPVHWINYFNGGDAVHSFPRAHYGFPQSLGCVELPIQTGDTVFHAVHYGTLVTVNAPGIPPAPATAGAGSSSTNGSAPA